MPASHDGPTDRPSGAVPEPATVAVRHRVRPGAQARYEDWIGRVTRTANRFAGHAGVHVIPPGRTSSVYTLLVRFGTRAQAEAWMASPERAACLDEIRPLLVETEQTRIGDGLEFWFTQGDAGVPRHRQFLVTLSAIYPLSLLVGYLTSRIPVLMPPLDHPAILGFVTSAVIVGSMTYIVMPPYTRLIRGWLYS